MTMKCGRVVQVVVAMVLVVLGGGPASAQDPWQVNERRVEEQKLVERLRDVALKEAQAKEEAKLVDDLKRVMKVVGVDPQRVVLAQGQQTRQPRTRGFSVVLVLGDLQGTSDTPDNVPEAAKKALADMKDFLPYKSYRLLDAAWILGEGQSTSQLKGVDEHPYSLELNVARIQQSAARFSAGGSLQMRVRLDEIDAGEPTQDSSLSKMAVELNAKLAAVRQQYTENHPEVVRAKQQLDTVNRLMLLGEVQGKGTVRRPVVATSFSMDVGETVVVGTSKVQGGKALILLLTAVPQGNP